MGDFFKGLAMAPQDGVMRSLQVLSQKDLPRLEAFFLTFDFDQRRAHFGGGMSDAAIRHACRSIHWDESTVIALSNASRVEAIAMVTALTVRQAGELSIACKPKSKPKTDRRSVIADLLDLALTAASLNYSQLVVHREHAMPELLSLLRSSPSTTFDHDLVRIDIAAGGAR